MASFLTQMAMTPSKTGALNAVRRLSVLTGNAAGRRVAPGTPGTPTRARAMSSGGDEDDWMKNRGIKSYKTRATSIPDYERQKDFVIKNEEYSAMDHETLLSSLRQFEPSSGHVWPQSKADHSPSDFDSTVYSSTKADNEVWTEQERQQQQEKGNDDCVMSNNNNNDNSILETYVDILAEEHNVNNNNESRNFASGSGSSDSGSSGGKTRVWKIKTSPTIGKRKGGGGGGGGSGGGGGGGGSLGGGQSGKKDDGNGKDKKSCSIGGGAKSSGGAGGVRVGSEENPFWLKADKKAAKYKTANKSGGKNARKSEEFSASFIAKKNFSINAGKKNEMKAEKSSGGSSAGYNGGSSAGYSGESSAGYNGESSAGNEVEKDYSLGGVELKRWERVADKDAAAASSEETIGVVGGDGGDGGVGVISSTGNSSGGGDSIGGGFAEIRLRRNNSFVMERNQETNKIELKIGADVYPPLPEVVAAAAASDTAPDAATEDAAEASAAAEDETAPAAAMEEDSNADKEVVVAASVSQGGVAGVKGAASAASAASAGITVSAARAASAFTSTMKTSEGWRPHPFDAIFEDENLEILSSKMSGKKDDDVDKCATVDVDGAVVEDAELNGVANVVAARKKDAANRARFGNVAVQLLQSGVGSTTTPTTTSTTPEDYLDDGNVESAANANNEATQEFHRPALPTQRAAEPLLASDVNNSASFANRGSIEFSSADADEMAEVAFARRLTLGSKTSTMPSTMPSTRRPSSAIWPVPFGDFFEATQRKDAVRSNVSSSASFSGANNVNAGNSLRAGGNDNVGSDFAAADSAAADAAAAAAKARLYKTLQSRVQSLDVRVSIVEAQMEKKTGSQILDGAEAVAKAAAKMEADKKKKKAELEAAEAKKKEAAAPVGFVAAPAKSDSSGESSSSPPRGGGGGFGKIGANADQTTCSISGKCQAPSAETVEWLEKWKTREKGSSPPTKANTTTTSSNNNDNGDHWKLLDLVPAKIGSGTKREFGGIGAGAPYKPRGGDEKGSSSSGKNPEGSSDLSFSQVYWDLWLENDSAEGKGSRQTISETKTNEQDCKIRESQRSSCQQSMEQKEGVPETQLYWDLWLKDEKGAMRSSEMQQMMPPEMQQMVQMSDNKMEQKAVEPDSKLYWDLWLQNEKKDEPMQSSQFHENPTSEDSKLYWDLWLETPINEKQEIEGAGKEQAVNQEPGMYWDLWLEKLQKRETPSMNEVQTVDASSKNQEPGLYWDLWLEKKPEQDKLQKQPAEQESGSELQQPLPNEDSKLYWDLWLDNKQLENESSEGRASKEKQEQILLGPYPVDEKEIDSGMYWDLWLENKKLEQQQHLQQLHQPPPVDVGKRDVDRQLYWDLWLETDKNKVARNEKVGKRAVGAAGLAMTGGGGGGGGGGGRGGGGGGGVKEVEGVGGKVSKILAGLGFVALGLFGYTLYSVPHEDIGRGKKKKKEKEEESWWGGGGGGGGGSGGGGGGGGSGGGGGGEAETGRAVAESESGACAVTERVGAVTETVTAVAQRAEAVSARRGAILERRIGGEERRGKGEKLKKRRAEMCTLKNHCYSVTELSAQPGVLVSEVPSSMLTPATTTKKTRTTTTTTTRKPELRSFKSERIVEEGEERKLRRSDL